MGRVQFWLATVLGALCLALAASNITLVSLNRGLQGDIGLRQQYVQQSVQLEGLYREIVRALAELGARNNDDAVRSLLARHGISYSVNAAPAAGNAAAPVMPRK
jgi:hypothetical protein